MVIAYTTPPPSLQCIELEALGDDFLGEDEDASYLDAVGAPDPPTTVPGDSGRVEVCHCNYTV